MAAFATASPALAEICEPTTSTPLVDTMEVSAATGQPHYYVATDPCEECTTMGRYVLYEESNAVPGLQRADDWVDDTCRGVILGDTFHEWM